MHPAALAAVAGLLGDGHRAQKALIQRLCESLYEIPAGCSGKLFERCIALAYACRYATMTEPTTLAEFLGGQCALPSGTEKLKIAPQPKGCIQQNKSLYCFPRVAEKVQDWKLRNEENQEAMEFYARQQQRKEALSAAGRSAAECARDSNGWVNIACSAMPAAEEAPYFRVFPDKYNTSVDILLVLPLEGADGGPRNVAIAMQCKEWAAGTYSTSTHAEERARRSAQFEWKSSAANVKRFLEDHLLLYTWVSPNRMKEPRTIDTAGKSVQKPWTPAEWSVHGRRCGECLVTNQDISQWSPTVSCSGCDAAVLSTAAAVEDHTAATARGPATRDGGQGAE
jgi:hypothetical protein